MFLLLCPGFILNIINVKLRYHGFQPLFPQRHKLLFIPPIARTLGEPSTDFSMKIAVSKIDAETTHISVGSSESGCSISYSGDRSVSGFEDMDIFGDSWKASSPLNEVSWSDDEVSNYAECCFIASTIMIRKTLEDICRETIPADKDFIRRLKDLGTRVMIPGEIINRMNDQDLTGNDPELADPAVFPGIGRQSSGMTEVLLRKIMKAESRYERILGKLRQIRGLRKYKYNA
jgi:hypothetical protein